MSQRVRPGAVAIVGIGCRFPGGVKDPAGFWRLLADGVDAISRIPADRFDVNHFFDSRPATPGRIMSDRGGFLDGLREFDADFFGISPREAERLDPQQRLLLETAWEALEDAGQDVRGLEGTTTGVYVGQWVSDFESRLFADPESVDFYMTMGSGRYASSGRISYALGLRGPSLTLDTACSSSLAAVHLGVRSIREGESSLVLAGGVNLILQPQITIAYSQPRMMAADGHCKFGDASGDGYVRSEGAGMVVLKALDRALADGDRIYAVIRGSAINNDGRTSGTLGRPSRLGQEELLRAAYRDAAISPGRVGYVEAHGTGTRAGDPVELGALNTVLAEDRPAGRPLIVGSVKTNIGHTEAAAGVAGLIKAALALHHGRIPASLHCREPNPKIEWDVLPLEVARQAHDWPDAASRVAGVTSFGIGGSNAHVVLEAAPSVSREAGQLGPLVMPLSARTAAALTARVASVAAWLRTSGADPVDACHTAARLTALEHRAAFVAPDADTLLNALDAFVRGDAGAITGMVDPAVRPKVAFVVPGQGGQWAGMARELMRSDATFRATIEACDAAITEVAPWSLVAQLAMEQSDPRWLLDRIDVIQPALVAVAIAYAAWWRARGLVPDAVVGHSMGEVGAAYLAGAIDLRTAMHLICRRSALMHRTAGQGAMALLELTVDEARARLVGHEDRVTVAVSNSPRSTVISGDPGTVKAIVAAAELDGVFSRLVKVDVASHSPQMEPLAAEQAADFAHLAPAGTRVPLYSSVLARRTEGRELGGRYWGRNLREPVRFADTITAMMADGIDVFIELGPHPVLKPALEQTGQAEGRSIAVVACGARDEDSGLTLLHALASAWAGGAPVSLRRGGGRHVSLPAYPWQREHHWVEVAEVQNGNRARPRVALDATLRSWIYRMQWAPFTPGDASGAEQRWLVVGPAEGSRALGRAAASAGAEVETTTLETLTDTLRGLASEGRVPSVVAVLADDAASPWVPLDVARTLIAQRFVMPPRVWFVTRGAHAVVGGDAARIRLAHAALWGAALVVGQEHPEFRCGLVDLEAGATIDASGEMLVRVVRAGVEDQVALRADGARARRLAPATLEQQGTAPAIKGPWLITGGLGDVGLLLARQLADAGARRVILMGRTPLPPRSEWNGTLDDERLARRVAAVRELESRGVAVHLAPVDVADPVALESVLRQYAAEAWPPIRGVIHAAAILRNQLIDRMDRSAFDEVVRTKLESAVTLDRLLPDVDAFVLLSSIASFIPQPGKSSYAAACAGLDALAEQRRARGGHALTIQWGVWQGTGLISDESGERGVEEMRKHGIDAFTPAQGVTIFEALVTRGTEGTVAVLPADWVTWRDARRGHSSTIALDLIADAPVSTSGGPDAPAGDRVRIERVVREAIGHVLKVAPARIDPRRTLGAMGLNSLLAMELRNRLEASLGRALSATIAYNHPTLDALVGFLAGDGAAAAAAPEPSAAPVDVAPAGAAQEATLSDEEALKALRRRGTGSSA